MYVLSHLVQGTLLTRKHSFLSNGWLPTAMSPKFAEAELMQVSYLWYDIDKEHVKYVLDPSEVQKWLFVS